MKITRVESIVLTLPMVIDGATPAETFGVQVVPHSAYFGPGLLASAVPQGPEFGVNPATRPVDKLRTG